MILLLVLLKLSCKKELSVFPTTSEVDGNVIVDFKSASTVLNGVYYRFAAGGADDNSVPSTMWYRINEIIPSELCGSLTNLSGDDGFYSLSVNANINGLDAIWIYGYQLVNAANGFLKNVSPVATISTAAKKQMIAEAKFLRAFGNTQLLLYYGQYYDPASKYGIILRDDFVNASNINLPRSTVTQTYTAILTDLEAAIPELPKVNTSPCYANASAAKLLEARLLINRGSSGDYAKVISLSADVIANGGFKLEANTKDLFLNKGFTSNEVILGIQPFATQTVKFQSNQHNGQNPASDAFVSLLTNDPRSQWVYRPDNGGTVYGPLDEITKYYAGDTGNPVKTPLSEYSYAFRLTEAYLLQAEAITLLGEDLGTARNLLKQVKKHAGVADFNDIDAAATGPQLHLLVVKEEIKNFFAEAGQDWFALRRLSLASAQTIQPALISTRQYIFQIPNSEIISNGNIIQNP
jgi:hypothetical protein